MFTIAFSLCEIVPLQYVMLDKKQLKKTKTKHSIFTNIHADVKPSDLEQWCLSVKALKNNCVITKTISVHDVVAVNDSDAWRSLLRIAQYRLRVETNKLK